MAAASSGKGVEFEGRERRFYAKEYVQSPEILLNDAGSVSQVVMD